jgi:phospholipid transport system substrate-binding protein
MRLQTRRAVAAAARRIALVSASVCIGALAAGQELATQSPEAAVRSLHRGLVAAADGASLEERYRALEPVIAATHDLPYIAEFALRRQWPALTAAERQRFVQAFTRLSVTTYASRFAGVAETTFEVTGAMPPDGERATVTALIHRAEGGDVPLEYSLRRRDGGWQIINIVADGVSDLALKRAEYQRVLGAGSLDDLVAHIDEQTARLR